jgi:hypothetical protein
MKAPTGLGRGTMAIDITTAIGKEIAAGASTITDGTSITIGTGTITIGITTIAIGTR